MMMFGLVRDSTLAISSSFTSVYLLFTSQWQAAIGTQALAAVFSGLALAAWLKLYKADQNGLWLLTMLPIIFVPGFCIVALPAAMVYGATPPKRKVADLTMLVPTPELPFKPLQFDSQLAFSRGGLFEVLERSADPDKRLTAVMATTRMQPQLAIPLLKIAMRDSVDDVRLLAYSIKDRHESEINDKIKKLSEGLGLSGSAEAQAAAEARAAGEIYTLERASAFRSLAFAYWELVYLEIAEGQIRNFCLQQTIKYAESAMHRLRDAPLAVLLARAQLQSADTESATLALETAWQFGMHPSVLAPQRAEIAFQEARFKDVPEELHGLSSESYERLNDVCDFWCVPA